MLLGALTVLCIIGILCVLIFAKNLRISYIVLFLIGFGLGFVVEYLGTTRMMWEYTETDMFMFFSIPFEILILYGTGLMFAGVMTLFLVQQNKKYDMLKITNGIFLALGLLFVIMYLVGTTAVVLLTFFAIWGMSVTKEKSVPMLLGIFAFITDVVIEGSLYAFTDYYEWTLYVPLSFMLFSIAFAGYLTSGKKIDG